MMVSAGIGDGSVSEPRTCEFGDVYVDFSRMTVTRAGIVVDIEPKVFDVLRFLIAHRDRLVTKEELLDGRVAGHVRRPKRVDSSGRAAPQGAGRRCRRASIYRDRRQAGIPVHRAGRHRRRRARRRSFRRRCRAVSPAPAVEHGDSRRRGNSHPYYWNARVGASAGPRRTRGPTGALTPARVSTSGGMNVEPALSPDGSAVAFASDRSGSFEIYVVSLARGSQEIADHERRAEQHAARLVAGRAVDRVHSNNGGGLWVVPSTGGTPRQLVESGSNPVWSPDSNWIAFTTQTGLVGQSNLRVVGRDGSGLRDLTHLGAPVGGHRSPAWSNSGRFIAFATVRGADEGQRVDCRRRRRHTAASADGVRRRQPAIRQRRSRPVFQRDRKHPVSTGDRSDPGHRSRAGARGHSLRARRFRRDLDGA